MRGFIVRSPESPRRSNLDASLDGVSKVHAADRSIEKFLSRRLARANLYFHEFTRDKLKGTTIGRDDLTNFGWNKFSGNATRFSLSVVGRDDRKHGGRIYEGMGGLGGRMRASTSRRRRMLIREIHQDILVPRF